MIDIEKSRCTGCYGCKNICPFNAIDMVEDIDGFIKPFVDQTKCKKCKRCINICPQLKSSKLNMPIKVYAAFCKNVEKHLSGSSGSVFGAVAEKILEKDGIVFGCEMDMNFNVKHVEISNINQLARIKKSKYVQSDINNSFAKVEEYLKNDKYVLFSGTPCQIESLKNFLNKEYDKLITVDVLCHGVPNNRIFKDFIEYFETKHNCKIKEFDFRYKNKKIGKYITRIKTSKNREFFYPWQGTSYTFLFMNDYILRESCYDCKYVTLKRVSDISLGDYWNIEKKIIKFNNNLGTSMVLINSEKGLDIFNEIKNSFEYIETDCEDAVKSNLTLWKKIPKPEERDEIIRDYIQYGYKRLELFYKKKCKKRKYYIFAMNCKRYLPNKFYRLFLNIKKRGKNG